jgi:molybdate transport system ATP-binding protein
MQSRTATVIELDCTVVRGDFTLHAQLATTAPVTGIFGRSGAGKSTLLHAVAGLVPLRAGTIRVHGMPWEHLPAHHRRAPVVFQDGRLFPHRSVRGNLLYGERPGSPSLPDIVELLELGPLLERSVLSLSGGERQRVAIGRALLAAPELLLLDEPLTGLDRGLKRRVLPFLRVVRDRLGLPMLHVSHDLSELLQVTDHLALIEAGRVVASGPLSRLCADPRLVPLLHDLGLANPLRGRITACDGDGLMIEIGNLHLSGTGSGRVGEIIDLSIDPAAIALALGPVPEVSLRNQLPGRVLAVTITAERTLVVIDVGVPLIAEVSRPTVERFALAPGQPIHALFKTQAVRRWET